MHADYEINYKDTAEVVDGARHVVAQLCPWAHGLSESQLSCQEVRGGITNLLYKVEPKSNEQGHAALVRIFGEKTEILIDRTQDNHVFKLLSDLGFGPCLHGTFTNGRVEQWVESRPLEPSEMGKIEPVDFQKLISRKLAQMHDLEVPGSEEPCLWNTIYKWYDMASGIEMTDPEKQKKIEKLQLEWVYTQFEVLQKKLPSNLNHNGQQLIEEREKQLESADESSRQGRLAALRDAFTVTFCHNDLLSGNVLHVAHKESVLIIDYEYGGVNFVAFDIANHFCEYAGFDFDLAKWYPNRSSQLRFFEFYLEARKSVEWQKIKDDKESKSAYLDEFYDVINRFALASHFFWGLWALVQARYSPIDFDFLQYSLDRIGGYRQQFSDFY